MEIRSSHSSSSLPLFASSFSLSSPFSLSSSLSSNLHPHHFFQSNQLLIQFFSLPLSFSVSFFPQHRKYDFLDSVGILTWLYQHFMTRTKRWKSSSNFDQSILKGFSSTREQSKIWKEISSLFSSIKDTSNLGN